MSKPVIVLNLGAGVQSTCLLLMSGRGMLPKLDHAIFADTGWESSETYQHLEWLKVEAKRFGIPVHIVSCGRNIKEDALTVQVRGVKAKGERWASMPYRTVSPKGKVGMIRRQCTSEYKIAPIEKFLKYEILGWKKYQRQPKEHLVDQWYGITVDEVQRLRQSPDKYRRYCYPFCSIPYAYLSVNWTRQDCLRWLKSHYPDQVVPRSACIGCPFKANVEWRHLKKNLPDEWNDVVSFDKAIRHCGGVRGDMFIHGDCVPLGEVDVDSEEDKGQLNMFVNECEGMCGV